MQDNVENIYELTPLQQGLLVETLTKPASDAYIIQFVLNLETACLDVLALKRAWQRVLNRHAMLRSEFYWEDMEKPVQVVLRTVELPWEEQDWRAETKADAAQCFEGWRAADLEEAFALDEAPLCRCSLVWLADNDCRLVWTVHHLINDGWSYPLILNDLMAYYRHEAWGEPLTMSASRPFVDYIAWLQQQDQAQAEQFWRENLQGFTDITRLNVAAPSQNNKPVYRALKLSLSAVQTAALQQFATEQHLTLNTVLQGAWALLLSHYSRSDDIVFGGIVSGRPPSLAGVEAMVGMFTNTLPVRIKIDWQYHLNDWLAGLQQQQSTREEYAYCSLVDIQGWSEIQRGSPLFESIFAYENYPLEADWEQDGLITDMEAVEQVPYPLSCVAMLRGVMRLIIHYDASRYSADTIKRLQTHLQSLLLAMVAQPQARLVDLSLLTDAEQEQFQIWNQTAATYKNDKNLVALFEQQVAQTPTAIALSFAGQTLSYQELNEQANRLSDYLRQYSACGTVTNPLVAICMERSISMMVALLATLKAGAAYVPIDPTYPEGRVRYMLEDSQACLLLTQSHIQANLPHSTLRAECVLLCVDGLDVSACAANNPVSVNQAEDLAYVIYTSGSTGQPKGVALPHRALSNLLLWQQQVAGLDLPAKTLQFTTLSFDVSFQEIFSTWLGGGELVLIDDTTRRDAKALLDYLAVQQVERLFVPFVMLQQLAETFTPLHAATLALTNIITAGEQLRITPAIRQLFTALGTCRLHNHYGPSESHAITALTLPHDVASWPLLPSIGTTVSNNQLYVLDKRGQLAPLGVAGELAIAGENLARGYWNRPDLNTEKFQMLTLFAQRQRVYKTGDLVRWLEDGHLEYLGRVDHQVKWRGFRLELGEIEAVLAQHAAVQASSVIVYDAEGHKRLVAYVSLLKTITETVALIAELKAFLQTHLPEYMLPTQIEVLESLPLTPSGKVNRKALPAPTALSNGMAAEPQGDTEQQVASIWQAVLQLKTLSREDHFFDLGGHSLLATQVVSRINQAFDIDIPLRTLFDYPTLCAFATKLDECVQAQSLWADEDNEALEEL